MILEILYLLLTICLILILVVAGLVFWAIMLSVFLVLFLIVFWILMLIDACQRKFKSNGTKAAWIIIVIIFGALGATIYYFAMKRKNNSKK